MSNELIGRNGIITKNQSRVGGIYQDFTTIVSTNSNTTEVDLYSSTIRPNVLLNNGDKLYFEFYGDLNGGNNCSVKAYFAGTNIATAGSLTTGNGWSVTGYVVKTGASTATAISTFLNDISINIGVYTALTSQDFTINNILKVTGQDPDGTVNGVRAVFGNIIYYPSYNS